MTPPTSKDHDAMRFADRIAERTCAGIVQRGDVKNFAAVAAGGELAEAFRAGKGTGRIGLVRVVAVTKYGVELGLCL
jgi:hypothetical protein